MTELTVGEAAALVNVGLIIKMSQRSLEYFLSDCFDSYPTTLVQLTLPLFQALILAGFLRTKAKAVTW